MDGVGTSGLLITQLDTSLEDATDVDPIAQARLPAARSPTQVREQIFCRVPPGSFCGIKFSDLLSDLHSNTF